MSGRCFKLVCGAGNEDTIEVERLVALYSSVGVRYFDLSANVDVVKSAYRGLEIGVPDKEKRKKYFLNVSVGIKGDPHVRKAKIITEKCVGCSQCVKSCIQNAIACVAGEMVSLDKSKCLGCGKCESACSQNAITFSYEDKPLKEVLPPLIDLGISSIEFHALTGKSDEIIEKWNDIQDVYDGILSLCTDRSNLSDSNLENLIEHILENREDNTTIIQADGCPMSGGKDDYATSLQAVAIAQIVERMNKPIFLLVSGGTNSKTAEMLKKCNISAQGISVGSYARCIVKKYIDRDDFYETEVFEMARKIAGTLVNELQEVSYD
jgi:Fe-S-cluster-containing hydrogenase component 2